MMHSISLRNGRILLLPILPAQPFSIRVVASGDSLIDQRADVFLDGVWVRGVILRAGVPLSTELDSAILTNNLQSVERRCVLCLDRLYAIHVLIISPHLLVIFT